MNSPKQLIGRNGTAKKQPNGIWRWETLNGDIGYCPYLMDAARQIEYVYSSATGAAKVDDSPVEAGGKE